MPDINRDNAANPGYALICVSGYLVRWRMERPDPAFILRGCGVWPETASPPRRPHESRHRPRARRGRERGGSWLPPGQRWYACSEPPTIRTSVRADLL